MISRRLSYRAVLVSLFAGGIAWYLYTPSPKVISLRIDQPYDEVVRESSYPITEAGGVQFDNREGFGWTDVTKPSVIIRFNDPKYGFTLPPTTFAGITYMDRKVMTIATSPMLKKLPFNDAVEELATLQAEFMKKGWQVDQATHTRWFDLSPAGRMRLHDYLRGREIAGAEEVQLIVPQKYAMVFRIKCVDSCDSKFGRDRYLIDIGIGRDYYD